MDNATVANNTIWPAWSSGSSAVLVIDMISVENLLAPFRCVLGKDNLRHFPLLGGLGKQFIFQSYLY